MKTLVLCLALLACYAEDTSSDRVPISPSALSGILIVLMLLVFLSVGLGALGGIDGPTTYSNVPLLVGKER